MEKKLKADGTPDKRFKLGKELLDKFIKPKEQEEPEKQEEIPDLVAETHAEEEAKAEEAMKKENPVQNQPITSEEKALQDRLSKDYDKEWETITEESMLDYSLDKDPYPLPPEAKKLQDEKVYAFKWALADIRRIDELRSKKPPEKWWPCNRTNTPFLDQYCDSIHGGVQHKDQVLMFKPYRMHRIHKDAELSLGEAKIRAGDVDLKDGEEHDWGEFKSGPNHAAGGTDQIAQYDVDSEGNIDIKGFHA